MKRSPLCPSSWRHQRRIRKSPKYLEGVRNGNYFRIKIPKEFRHHQKEENKVFPSRWGKLQSLPPPTYPQLPISLGGLLFGGAESSPSRRIMSWKSMFQGGRPHYDGKNKAFTRRRLYEWMLENWPIAILNFGSVCTLVAFTRSDVLELRALSATGSVSNAVFRLTQSPVQWLTVAWPAVFASVNGVKIYEILQERNAAVHLSEKQQDIYVQFFMPHGCTPKQFERIYQKAAELRLKKGQALIRKGDKMDHIFLVIEGSTQAHILGRHLTAASTSDKTRGDALRIGGDSGAWVGEMTFLEHYFQKVQMKNKTGTTASTKTTTARSTAGSIAEAAGGHQVSDTSGGVRSAAEDKPKETPPPVVAVPAARPTLSKEILYTILAEEDCTVLAWSFAEMEELMSSSIDMRGALTRSLTAAVVGKVVNMTVSRTSAVPTWSTWLNDWSRKDGAKVQIRRVDTTVPEKETSILDDPTRELTKGIEEELGLR
jgi:CRP-like cAMP-binding protein